MAKRNNFITAALVILILHAGALADTKAITDKASELFKSLKPEQKSRAVSTFDDKQRSEEKFPAGPRLGIQLRDLDEAQRAMAMDLLTMFTSDYGKKKCEAIGAQEKSGLGLGQYYIAFFGEPGEGNDYAWRIADHHLTLVHMEIEKGEPKMFGPILLGADPGVLWDEDEEKMMALYKSLSADDKAKCCKKGKSASAQPIGDAGAQVSDLSQEAQDKVKAVFEQRLAFYSPDIQQRVAKIVEDEGGLPAMKLVFFGEATKKCADGGKWDFKLGNAAFLCDYENTRGHIHLTMKAKAKG